MEEIKIKAHLKNKDYLQMITYSPEIIKLSYHLHEELTSKLEPVIVDGQYLYYSLPSQSTFFIGEGANFRNFTFDEIEITLRDKEKVVLNGETQNLLQKEKSFPNKHFAWYDIK